MNFVFSTLSCIAFAASALALLFGSQKVMIPPYDSTALTFEALEFDGITMYAGREAVFAARERAAAWLPEEWVTTPERGGEREGEERRDWTAFVAPRYLKEPVF